MACTHVDSCELFVQFALNPALDIWKEHYCEGDFNSCVRYVNSGAGQPIPLTLLPNGVLLTAERSSQDVGATALFNAILKHRPKMVSSLIRVGADVNARNIEGRTVLMVAAEQGIEDIVRVLLEHGADVEAVDMYGETAADLAARGGHASVVAILGREDAA